MYLTTKTLVIWECGSSISNFIRSSGKKENILIYFYLFTIKVSVRQIWARETLLRKFNSVSLAPSEKNAAWDDDLEISINLG